MSLEGRLKAIQALVEQTGDPMLKVFYLSEYVDAFKFALNGEAQEHYAFAARHYEGIINRLGEDGDPEVIKKLKKLARDYGKKGKPQNLTSAPPSSNP